MILFFEGIEPFSTLEVDNVIQNRSGTGMRRQGTLPPWKGANLWMEQNIAPIDSFHCCHGASSMRHLPDAHFSATTSMSAKCRKLWRNVLTALLSICRWAISFWADDVLPLGPPRGTIPNHSDVSPQSNRNSSPATST